MFLVFYVWPIKLCQIGKRLCFSFFIVVISIYFTRFLSLNGYKWPFDGFFCPYYVTYISEISTDGDHIVGEWDLILKFQISVRTTIWFTFVGFVATSEHFWINYFLARKPSNFTALSCYLNFQRSFIQLFLSFSIILRIQWLQLHVWHQSVTRVIVFVRLGQG